MVGRDVYNKLSLSIQHGLYPVMSLPAALDVHCAQPKSTVAAPNACLCQGEPMQYLEQKHRRMEAAPGTCCAVCAIPGQARLQGLASDLCAGD